MVEEHILGTKINSELTYETTIAYIAGALKSGKSGIICTTNPEFVIAARNDPSFQQLINSSLLSVPDGFGVLVALEFQNRLKKKLKVFSINTAKDPSNLSNITIWKYVYLAKSFQVLLLCSIGVAFDAIFRSKLITGTTITGIDLIPYICEFAQKEKLSMFLLGGWPKNAIGKMKKVDFDLATLAGTSLKKQYPNLHLVGSTSQYSHKKSEDAKTIAYIKECMTGNNVSSVDIILVAYNHKNQEAWLKRNMPALNAKLGVGVGGSFDYIAGTSLRSPKVVRTLHMEWLFRLVTQPYRFKRIFTAFLVFPLHVFINELKRINNIHTLP